MIVKAGKNMCKGKYLCKSCGAETEILCDGDKLNPCKCGCEKFDFNLIFNRSNSGISEKLTEVINILEVCTFLVEALDLESFLNVIAIQLRILLCDSSRGKNTSLITKVFPDIKIHPIKVEYLEPKEDDTKIIPSYNIFDKDAVEISLFDWLNQNIINVDKEEKNITIRDIIRIMADKNGGAHLDISIKSYELMTIVLAKNYLIRISHYIIEKLQFDFEKDLSQNLLLPYEKIKLKK